MTSTILGLFEQPIAARRAMDQLRNSSLTIEDISIISRATESGEAISSVDDVGAGEGAAVGAVWGGLVGLASLLIPGVGPFIALGALGATLTGAVTGAVVGGITAALIDFGDIPEAEARAYEERIHAGGTLVAGKVNDRDAAEARRILVDAGADSLYDNQTDAASDAQGARVQMNDATGQPASLAHEYGAPADPSTVRTTTTAGASVDRAADSVEPVAENPVTVVNPLIPGQAGLMPADSAPRELRERVPESTMPDGGELPREEPSDTNIPPEEPESRPKV